MLDDHRANDQTGILAGATLGAGQTFVVGLGQLIPGNALTHFDPAVLFIEAALERPVKLRQGELPITLSSDHSCTLFAS